MVDAVVTKRLHVGGLTPAITTAHIKERFSSFGTVSDVEELGPDALGQPRPFTFLTLQSTPVQLKKCLNILSGSFWRGTQLRLSEAKPNFTEKYKEPESSQEEKRKLLEKKRKRVESSRGEDVGKLAQDIRLVTPKIAEKKKFWITQHKDGEDCSSRIIRPITIRPSHPIGKPLIDNQNQSLIQQKLQKKDTMKTKKRTLKGPPARLRRKVINPISWGSIYVTGDQLNKIYGNDDDEKEKVAGDWEFEEFSDNDEEEQDENPESIIGIWKKIDKNGDIIEENLVKGNKKRKLQIQNEDEYNYGEFDFDNINLKTHTHRANQDDSSPLFGHRELPQGEEEGNSREGSSSPLFPSRQIANEDTSSTSSEAEHESASSPLFPTRKAIAEERERSASPLFPIRNNEDVPPPSSPRFPSRSVKPDITNAAEQPSSPLFPARKAHSPKKGTPSDAEGENVQKQFSPLFPIRNAKSPSPIRLPTPPPAKKLPMKPKINLPEQVLASARAEKSSALGLLSSFIGESSPSTKKEKIVWEVYPESDDDDIEYGRGRSKSNALETPIITKKAKKEESVNIQEPDLNIPINQEPVDASSASSSSSSSDSGSSSSSSSSGSSDNDDKMDVDKPAGNGENEESSTSGSGSGSSSSGSSSGSGDDDDGDDDDSSSESDSTGSESDSDSEDSDEEEEVKKTTDEIPTKTSGLKEMFAPSAAVINGSSSLNFGSTSNVTSGGGFSLMANFGDEIEIDEDMDIPLPPSETELSSSKDRQENEEGLQPLQLLTSSSSRGKVKFDSNSSELPLFFTLPTTQDQSTSATRKGESRNLYNELYTGVPIIPSTTSYDDDGNYGQQRQQHGQYGQQNQYGQNGYYQNQQYQGEAEQGGDEEEEEVKTTALPGFNKENGETDEQMKTKWENEKLDLTQAWKKRFREAKKSKRRKGGEEVE
ncbi:uncharacterized protein L201_000889 [Kwoniella dendrophila CBS 6074]|uniref:RRM domain-containing protein n=1 Tax=Kwoniella dendrophila CBS 6074 TaxID=1295534 RepID=A0AAX4JMD9_9TREE